MDGHHGAALVVTAAEEALFFAVFELALEGRHALAKLSEERFVDLVGGELLADHLFGGLEVAETALERGEVVEPALEAAVGGRRGLRGLGVVPEVGGPHALFERFDVGSQARGVKDSSAAN